jgi:hypothetical protein
MSSTSSKWIYPKSVKIDFQRFNEFITSKVPFMNRYLPLHTELCILIIALLIILLLILIIFLIIIISLSITTSDWFSISCLKSHNEYRYRHKSPFLKIDDKVILTLILCFLNWLKKLKIIISYRTFLCLYSSFPLLKNAPLI